MFELIEVEGQAYERGRQHGARASAAIHRNAADYLELIQAQTGLDPTGALQTAQAYLPLLQAHVPDLLAEMRGIAAGAGCDLAHILLINVRSELLANASECTALAVAPEVSRRRRPLLAQNWDWHAALDADPILLRIRQPGKPEILTLTEAGQVGKIGLNSAGLGVCLNFLSHSHRGPGLPVHVILRRSLESATVAQAVHAALGLPRGGSANVLLAHDGGEILDLELTATDADTLHPEGGWLVHTNHYESPRLRTGDTGLSASPSTTVRAARARRLLSAAAPRCDVSFDSLATILRDHAHGAHAICRHPDPSEPAFEQTATRASVIMDLAARTLHLAPGQPCRQDYQPFPLDPLSD